MKNDDDFLTNVICVIIGVIFCWFAIIFLLFSLHLACII